LQFMKPGNLQFMSDQQILESLKQQVYALSTHLQNRIK
jgi:hypothetical protein